MSPRLGQLPLTDRTYRLRVARACLDAELDSSSVRYCITSRGGGADADPAVHD